MTETANMNGGGDGPPKAPPRMVNPYISMDNPEEPQIAGFGLTFLGLLSQMVNEYQIMPQQLIAKLTPSADERASILRQKAAAMMEAANKIEAAGDVQDEDDGKPKWGSKWKN